MVFKNGGLLQDNSNYEFPPPQVIVTTPFYVRPRFKDKEFLQRKYVAEGLSIDQISTEIGSSKDAVRRWLKRYEIPIREHGRHHGRPSQPRFGTKIRHGKSEPHLFEQSVIESVRSMRSKGLSLREIAQTLTNLQISTKKRGKAWHPEMVKRKRSMKQFLM